MLPQDKEKVKQGQEEIELEQTVNIRDAEIDIKDLTSPLNSTPDGFMNEFYQNVKESLISIFCKLFQKAEETAYHCFSKSSVIDPQTRQDDPGRENHGLIAL